MLQQACPHMHSRGSGATQDVYKLIPPFPYLTGLQRTLWWPGLPCLSSCCLGCNIPRSPPAGSNALHTVSNPGAALALPARCQHLCTHSPLAILPGYVHDCEVAHSQGLGQPQGQIHTGVLAQLRQRRVQRSEWWGKGAWHASTEAVAVLVVPLCSRMPQCSRVSLRVIEERKHAVPCMRGAVLRTSMQSRAALHWHGCQVQLVAKTARPSDHTAVPRFEISRGVNAPASCQVLCWAMQHNCSQVP